ncbi:MAG TPA: PepSY-associated TM helix domain-containing protein [Thermoanaerobaculia bacterium]|nr:PepSY-associated TM helix domain-containing protein [Thermoanaerobaculia bacterium]
MMPRLRRGQQRPPAARFRSVIFWLHLAAGVTAGAVILVMSVTGVLLMYERQIMEWADEDYRVATPSPGAARLPVETLVARVLEKNPGTPSSVTVQADPGTPVSVSLGREKTVYVDPYTGRVLGPGSKKVRAFFHAVTDWHRWLGAGGERRDTGRAVTGAANLAFLVLVVSGLYLWLPRQWTRRQVRNVTWFRRGLPGKARDFNWHNVIGFWSWVPLFLIVLSGVVLSYPWAGDLLFRLAGEEPPARRDGPRRTESEGGPVPLDGLDELWAVAERQMPGWRSLTLRLPGSPEDPVTFSILQGDRGRPDLRAQLTLDRASGEIVKWEPYASQSLGRRLRSWPRWVHTGEAGGIAGQTLAGLASAGAAVLVWTGIALAWRRFFAAVLRRRTYSRPVHPAVSIQGESQEEPS